MPVDARAYPARQMRPQSEYASAAPAPPHDWSTNPQTVRGRDPGYDYNNQVNAEGTAARRSHSGDEGGDDEVADLISSLEEEMEADDDTDN